VSALRRGRRTRPTRRLPTAAHGRANRAALFGLTASLSTARAAARAGGRCAHRLRYLPLTLVGLGALMVLIGPRAHVVGTDALGDDSMAPTLAAGEPLAVQVGAFAHATPAVGDIVTFHPPAAGRCARRPSPMSACPFPAALPAGGQGIKRIVAGPGDRVALRAGHLLVNGRPVAEPYARWPCVLSSPCDLPRPVRVPPGTWWLLADNRNDANDSRTYGPIPTGWITGRVKAPT
jgi:signal peptidase I